MADGGKTSGVVVAMVVVAGDEIRVSDCVKEWQTSVSPAWGVVDGGRCVLGWQVHRGVCGRNVGDCVG